jgi:hypothetical protein
VAGTLVLAFLSILVGMAKVQRLPASLQIRDQVSVSPLVWVVSGWIELFAAAGLVVGIFVAPELAVVSAAVLVLTYGWLAAKQLADRRPAVAVPAIGLTVLSLLTIAAIFIAG